MLRLAALFLLYAQRLGECLSGCLKCSSNDDCLFCDFKNNYFLLGTICQVITFQNCALQNTVGTCVSCEKGYFLDFSTGKCAKVTPEISNCSVYLTTSTCSQCEAGFIVSNSACVAVPKPIEGCQVYDSSTSGLCVVCATGRVLSLDASRCDSAPAVANCASFNSIVCNGCVDGYFLNYNKYQDDLFEVWDENSRFLLKTKLSDEISGGIDQRLYSFCSKIKISHCVSLSNYFTCSTCESGYFVDSTGDCVAFPAEAITGCEDYSAPSVCLRCSGGRYLAGPSECRLNTEIKNCLSFSSTASTTTCLRCTASFYLSSNACVARSASVGISKCDTPSLTSDTCGKCETGFLLTSDALSCLAAVSNCETYASSTKNTQSLTCTRCSPGFFIDQTEVCTPGSVASCRVYDTTSNTCSACVQGYFLASSTSCLPHTPIEFCLSFDPLLNGQCTKCKQNFVLFGRTNGCLPVTKIDNCSVYNSTTTCTECSPGYYLANSTACNAITTITNCLQLDGGACKKCRPQYFIGSSNNCGQPEAYFTTNCLETNVDGEIYESELKCNKCAAGTLPMNYTNSSVCIQSSSISTDNTIANCLKYSNDNGVLSCTMCDSGLFISGRSCVSSCPDGTHLRPLSIYQGSYIVKGSTTIDYFYVQRVRVCQTSTSDLTGCSQAFPAVFSNPTSGNDASYQCGRCATNFVAAVVSGTASFGGDASAPQTSNSPLAAFIGITCVVSSSATLVPVPSCQYYYLRNAKYVCLRCAFGYTGKVGDNGGIVSCSSSVLFCDGGVYRHGSTRNKNDLNALKSTWETFFTCHSCSAGLVPFVALSFSAGVMPTLKTFVLAPATGQTYGVASVAAAPNGGGTVVNCLSVDSESALNLGINPTKFNFPKNCGLGVINVGGTGDASESAGIAAPNAAKTSVYCTACAPGFAPSQISNTAQVLMMYACTAIDSCDPSAGLNWFNSCSKCLSGYTFDYDDTQKDVVYERCVAYTDPNCFASTISVGSPAGSNTRRCALCSPGYSLNIDGICELINAPKCVQGQYMLAAGIEVAPVSDRRGTGLFLAPQGPGCYRCDSGFVAMRRVQEEWVCTQSSYLSAGKFAAGSSKLSANCQNYAYDRTKKLPVCVACVSGFLVASDGACLAAAGLQNCDLAAPSTGGSAPTCERCRSGFANISGVCQAKSIDNCLTYIEGPKVTSASCGQCAPGYFPSAGGCVAGSVQNCKILTADRTCAVCMAGYSLANVQGGASYCFRISPELNCANLGSKLDVNVAECSVCQPGYFPSTLAAAFNRTICLEISPSPNCQSFNVSSTLSGSTLLCAKCVDGFYLDSNARCQPRLVTPRNCVGYDFQSDKCSACLPGFFVDKDGSVCVAFPIGIKGCSAYFNATVCTSCGESLYLFNNTCVAVDKPIPNCKLYASAIACSSCGPGYATFNGACVASQATNCATWKSETACNTCPPGFGLQSVSGVVSCVKKTDTKCLSSEDVFPFKCFACSTDYFAQNGVCQPVTKSIPNCEIYETGTVCRSCLKGFVLHSNKTACIDSPSILAQTDFNCAINLMQAAPVCAKCSPGYFFSDGKCKICDKNPLSDGCYQCNHYDQTLCLMCDFGWFQDYTGKCTKNIAAVATRLLEFDFANLEMPNGAGSLGLLTIALFFSLIF